MKEIEREKREGRELDIDREVDRWRWRRES